MHYNWNVNRIYILFKFCYMKGMKKLMTLRIDQDLKEFLQKMATEENRSLSNFLINAAITYVKDHHGVAWTKPKKSADLLLSEHIK